jgi:hypothetical protein
MNVIRWPEPFDEKGRLSEGAYAHAMGAISLAEGPPRCPQTLYVNLFFDGTNNNMKWDMQNKERPTHTNVARLYNACPPNKPKGIFSDYIPGVGTPFPEIGEYEFSRWGKAFAWGFGKRVVWGYTCVLNALHEAMAGPPLLDKTDASALCALIDDDVTISDGAVFKALNLAAAVGGPIGEAVSILGDASKLIDDYRSHRELARLHQTLAMLQRKHSKPGGQLNRSIQKVWVNVFGFSRGAASARVFVNRLINTWAPNGLIAGAIPYEVSFLGLFDTVASVGLPDSTTALVHWDELDGHWLWTANGALNVPTAVRRCAHFFSIHEQRMSFPLDSIRENQAYPIHAPRWSEIAYPGVHSDVGGGYAIRDEGKARDDEGSKLSQIALHNMYIEALDAGVPLSVATVKTPLPKIVEQDFLISPSVVHAFNDWLATVNEKPLDSVETAVRAGMAQSLAWRTLRADRDNLVTYITSQTFFQRATEDPLTPYGLETEIASPPLSSSPLDALKREKNVLEAKRTEFEMAAMSLPPIPELTNPYLKKIDELSEQIKVKEAQIEQAAADWHHAPLRPGDDITSLATNDQTDLLEGTEGFHLLLAYLRPDQRSRWQAYWAPPPASDVDSIPIAQKANAYYLTVDRKGVSAHRRQGSKAVWMGTRDWVMQLLVNVAHYQPVLDFVLAPHAAMLPFLLEHTTDEAVRALPKAVIRLLDDYVHDSRAWFRVPYFHEYAPGGYGWARTFFAGNDQRQRYLGLPDSGMPAVTAERERKEAINLHQFMAVVKRASSYAPPPDASIDRVFSELGSN